MKYIKHYDGFLIPKNTEEDKIALEYIKRLEKVKNNNPYKIVKKEETINNAGRYVSYQVVFDDTPITIKHGYFNYSIPRNQVSEGGRNRYKLIVDCTGDKEVVNANKKYLKKLFDLIEKIYLDTEYKKKIDKINININPDADLLQ